ncbi:MAG: hypothetical protein M3282_13230, partial [Gemmatimonadota bacterium]|nr:hypothetical protein [Gemmatimonadota bacterium]
MYIFIVDAGCSIASALSAKSVSPRVSETTMTPHSPLRVRPLSIEPRFDSSSSAVRGDVQRAGRAAAGAARAVRR